MTAIDNLRRIALGAALFAMSLLGGRAAAQTVRDQLVHEPLDELANSAREQGDARRGAVVFFQASLACQKCHSVDGSGKLLGPDLANLGRETKVEHLVESLLHPSKTIKKGFEPVVVQTVDGQTITGLLVEETAEKLALREVTGDGKTIALSVSAIEERTVGKVSIMPAETIQQLGSRQQFMDLIRYLLEIAAGGPARARELQPAAALLTFQLPEYESQLDHAGLISAFDKSSFKRGEAIYTTLCINCHGTPQRPGSLPTSLRFAAGKFKNGSDPFRMYQTLTNGFGLMAPQTWMVPQQKYDVIHYIREAYLKDSNPSQYVAIDSRYLSGLPRGTTRGPAPRKYEPWATMDYGPYLTATYEVGEQGSNFAHKGIAVRLDSGPGGVARGKHWMLFDHGTLRMAAAWSGTGFIDFNGINFNGRHEVHPRLSGHIELANDTGPGWAHPASGVWTDPRVPGRDGRRYGSLPRDWGKFHGYYRHGERLVFSYSVGDAAVLEMPGLANTAQGPVFTRTFRIGPRSRELILQVAQHPTRDTQPQIEVMSPTAAKPTSTVVFKPLDAATADAAATAELTAKSYFEVAGAEGFDWTTRDYSLSARIKTRAGGTILSQAAAQGKWRPDGKSLFVRRGKLCFDIGWVGVVQSKSSIDDGHWHDVAMSWQQATGQVRLYVDGKPDGEGTLMPKGAARDMVVRLGYTNSDFPQPSPFAGQIADARFYQRLLTNSEAAAPPEQDSQLLAWWKPERLENGRVEDRAGRAHHAALVRLSGVDDRATAVVCGVVPWPDGAAWSVGEERRLLLKLPPGKNVLRFQLAGMPGAASQPPLAELTSALDGSKVAELEALCQGGASQWPQRLAMPVEIGSSHGPFAADVLTLPTSNPWSCQMRLTGFDFYDDSDRAAVCTWDGDVWLVSGLSQLSGAGELRAATGGLPLDARPTLSWRRIAAGLFQPLGLKIVDGRVFVSCRDQIVILRDLNGDGETDYYECFNDDHQVTEHFHEFAMGLQTDNAGNFYYAKSARHALPAVVPQHGTLLRVLPDGKRTEIVATGFRAANGVCVNPDGTFVVTDQEGHWNPKNRINWVKPGGFYGNMFGYHDVTDKSDAAMEPPLCWITNAFDRSPAELLWVDSRQWGPLHGSLLNLSYGNGKVFVVPHETVDGRRQGGMCELPLPAFPTGIMRGRFHPRDGQLYACGMFAWAGNAIQPGGFYRVRHTGRAAHLPLRLNARRGALTIAFSDPLDPTAARDPSRYEVRAWSLKRTQNYGSAHYDERAWKVAQAVPSADGRTVELKLPQIEPTWCMSIRYDLQGADGKPVYGLIHNTIHVLAD